jgi:hypothetical protein
MSVQDDTRDKSLLDQAKDAIDDFFGGDAVKAAEQTPEAVGERLNMDTRERQDVGMGVPGVQDRAYGGSAGSQALDLANEEVEGTGQNPPDSALEPF